MTSTQFPVIDRRVAARTRRRLLWLAIAAWLAVSSHAAAATLEQVRNFGDDPGNLTMYKYVPAGLGQDAPLVVALHGCSQSAADYVEASGWDKLADENGFALVVPEQKRRNNGNNCFNWFLPGDHTRGQGEAGSIASMVAYMIANHGSDAGRVYVTGFSAGGGMTAAMLAAYPDVFAGGAIMAGVAYKCAESATQGFDCMDGYVDRTPAQWGDLVRAASSHTGPWPRVSIWHGTADGLVDYFNFGELIEQWTDVHGIDQSVDATETIGAATHDQYRDAGGVTQVETWSFDGMGHGIAIDPGTAPAQCGTAGSYAVDQNLCSSYRSAAYWGILAP